MGLKVGIVGLPNVGKSTLFNAIMGRQAALVAPYPFATVEPNVGVVEVADERLGKLRDAMFTVGKKINRLIDKKINRQMDKQRISDNQRPFLSINPFIHLSTNPLIPPIVPATITFVDIAGLVKGAAEGHGLGNQFLSHIRDVDLILHVLRDFDNPDIPRHEDSKNPEYDAQIVRTELELKDLEIEEREKGKKSQKNKRGEKDERGKMGRLVDKPVIYAINVGEEKLELINRQMDKRINREIDKEIIHSSINPLIRLSDYPFLFFCAKIEEEISQMPKNEQKEYLKIYGLNQSGLDRIISECFNALGLISFFTAGVKEVRAWPVRRDSPAPRAAAAIHSDFEKLFIRAEVIGWERLAEAGGWQEAKERGWVRTEGREYVVKDGDVCNFLITKV